MRRVRCQVCEREQWTTIDDPSCIRAHCRVYSRALFPAARRPTREDRGPGLGDLVAWLLAAIGITEQRWTAARGGYQVCGGAHCILLPVPADTEKKCGCSSRRARLNRWGDRLCDRIFGPTALAMRRTRRGRWWLRCARGFRDRLEIA